MNRTQTPLNIAAFGVSLPETSRSIAEIFEREAQRVNAQMNALSAGFRDRVVREHGIERVVCGDDVSSPERAMLAVADALPRAGVHPSQLGLIIDFSTYADDVPALWSLGHHVQRQLRAERATIVGTRGSGCCGLHVALRTAQAYFSMDPDLHVALLLASDRAPDNGRVCLPVSVMADGASALVITRPSQWPTSVGQVLAVAVHCNGRFVDVLRSGSGSNHIEIDGRQFEREVVPLHFIELNRVMRRAIAESGLAPNITRLVYPNTTQLDRLSVSRALQLDPTALLGPGPRHLGHVFASDLIINAREGLDNGSSFTSAWLAAGSGFTWGAAIVSTGDSC